QSKYKIIDAMDFYYIKVAGNTKDADAYMSFPLLLNEITTFRDEEGELVFIPVCQNDFHWSLLIYQVNSNKFYHYDTFGGANFEYTKSVVEDLLIQFLQIENRSKLELNKYLMPKHDIKQGNGYDCGVALITFVERIIKQG